MSERLRDLVMPVGEFDPPLDLHTRILGREAELASPRPPRRLPRLAVGVAAVAAALLIIGALALAAHSRSDNVKPAKSGIAPPRCTKLDYRNQGVVRNGFLVECGPDTAVVRTSGRLYAMEGNCTSRLDGGWLYFGVQTRRDVPHIGLTIHVPRPPYEHRPNRPYPINGTIEMLPGARESLSGIATFPTSDLLDGTFILHGRASGRTYTGSLNCGVG